MKVIGRIEFNKRNKKEIGKYHEERAEKEKQRLYTEIKEKVTQWKKEGYNIKELETLIENMEI